MYPFDFSQPFPSRRSPVMARRGMVATSHPLAAQAGLQMLVQGGNAVDAIVATAAALTVLEPTSNGLGSDAFALVWHQGRLYGLNASGRAPMALTADLVRGLGYTRMPADGWLPVTVPGAVSAWAELLHRFGSMPMTEVLRPAITYAEKGHPVPPVIAGYWRAAEMRFAKPDASPAETRLAEDFRKAFLPEGRAPRPGEVFRFPEQAESLRIIAESDGEAFYRGALADAIARYAADTGGYITREDLAAHRPEWVAPISTNYRGYDIWEIPPNGQGLAALIALNILEGYDIASLKHLSAPQAHLVIEALRLAFADAHAYIADPAAVPVPTFALLEKSYAARRRDLIAPGRAMTPPPPGLGHSDTVYLCAADGNGTMVSYIQSNFRGFGAGIVVPGTGISLQDRGNGFSLEPGHPNELAPGKRPYHTIIPSFITKDGVPLAAYGVMGGDMQPQGHVQVVLGLVDYHLNPQAAIDAARVHVAEDGAVELEPGFAPEVAQELAAYGHQVRNQHPMWFGGGQMIWRDPDTGVLVGASEPRKDGQAVGW